jgi:hypothetical protein
MLSLVEEHNLRPEDVEIVERHLRPKYSELLMYHDPGAAKVDAWS